MPDTERRGRAGGGETPTQQATTPATWPSGITSVVAFASPGYPPSWSQHFGQVQSPTDDVAPMVVTGISPTTGVAAGNEHVFVNGSGFTGKVLQVEFGGVMGTAVTDVSDTQVRVSTPAHAPGVVDVKIWPGAPIVLPGAFTYT